MPTRYVIDVDTALGIEAGDIDDAHAILFLAGQPDHATLAGVTCVAGNVSLPSASRSARLVCELLGLHTPIANGAAGPDDRPLITGHQRMLNDSAITERWIFSREPSHPPDARPAVQLLADVARDGAFDLLAVAPLTNVAAYLSTHTNHNIRRIVTMGGWFVDDRRGPEFNVMTDPTAARAVYASGIPTTIIPYNMTRRTLLQRGDIEDWPTFGEAGRLFHEGTLNWITLIDHRYGHGGCNLHDPLAAAYCIYPGFFMTRGIVPDVHPDTGYTDVAAWDDASPVRLVTDFDLAAFHDRFLESTERALRAAPRPG